MSRKAVTLLTLLLCILNCRAIEYETIDGIYYQLFLEGETVMYGDPSHETVYYVTYDHTYAVALDFYATALKGTTTLSIPDSVVASNGIKYTVERIYADDFQFDKIKVNKLIIPKSAKELHLSDKTCNVDSVIVSSNKETLKVGRYTSDEDVKLKYMELHRQIYDPIGDYPGLKYRSTPIEMIAIGSDMKELNLDSLKGVGNIINILPAKSLNDTIKITSNHNLKSLWLGRNIKLISSVDYPWNFPTMKSLKVYGNTGYPSEILNTYVRVDSLLLGQYITDFRFENLRTENYFIKNIDIVDGFSGYRFDREMGLLYNADQTELLFANQSPANKAQYDIIRLPETVTTIHDYVFYKTPVDTIIAPQLTNLGEGAFSDSSIKTIISQKSFKEIGRRCFYRCHNLNLDGAVFSETSYIGKECFYKCTNLTLNDVVFNEATYIGDLAFYLGPKISGNLDLPNIEFIGLKTFYGTGIKSLKLGPKINTIFENTFENCYNLSELVLGKSIIEIRRSAFKNCHELEQTELPENLKVIGDSAFYQCRNLTKVYFNKNLESIGRVAFARCNLSNINLYSKIKSLGKYAFAYNANLQTAYYDALNPVSASAELFSDYDTPILHIPDGTFIKYWKTCPWNLFKYIDEDPSLSTIDAIAVDDSELPILYYDLNGRLVNKPGPGIYIKKQGNKVEKVIMQ